MRGRGGEGVQARDQAGFLARCSGATVAGQGVHFSLEQQLFLLLSSLGKETLLLLPNLLPQVAITWRNPSSDHLSLVFPTKGLRFDLISLAF